MSELAPITNAFCPASILLDASVAADLLADVFAAANGGCGWMSAALPSVRCGVSSKNCWPPLLRDGVDWGPEGSEADVAASQFHREGGYRLAADGAELKIDALIGLLGQWCRRYPIVSLEDPLAEDADAGMVTFTALLGDRVQIIGYDYLVTSAERVAAAARGGRLQCGPPEAEPGGRRHRDKGGFAGGAGGGGLADGRVGAFRRNRGCDRSSRGWLECRSAQGGLVRAIGTDGETE